ncbi:MAG: COX aromatic rich motif-containing protein [Proteobacteria bacterium]|nr:COX aromatic rich motif-containing protein [Pseudomonadota bacterium]
MPMLNPVGDVTTTILDLFKFSTIVMLVIIVPVILGTLWIAWRYRDRPDHQGYDPQFDHSPTIDKFTFYVPLLTIATLGSLTWVYTHRLDPYRVRAGGSTPVPFEIQAVSLDYKWLFIYPEAGVATVNEMAAPIDRPVTIRITSDPMMTSLFIPSLVSQIYAMTGMETRANFMAPVTAELDGANAMYSGPGFSKQRFKVRLLAQPDFGAWLKTIGGDASAGTAKREPMLDMARYRTLAERSEGYPVTYFRAVAPGLFEQVVQQYQPRYRMNPLLARAEAPGATTAAAAATHRGH